MSTLSINVGVYAGSPIEEAAGDACVLATQLGCTIQFQFNGVECMAIPGGSSSVLIENWRAAAQGGERHPIASTNRRVVSAPAEPK